MTPPDQFKRLLREVRLAVVDRPFGPEVEDDAGLLGRTDGRRHARAREGRKLDRHMAGAAGAAMDEDELAGLHRRAVVAAIPSR